MVLGQIAVDTKSNEIIAIPKLLKLLTLKNTIVTADALNCQRTIAAQIVEQGGDYVLTLKGNQGTLHDDVVLLLNHRQTKTVAAKPTVDGDHGRIETRTATISTDVAYLIETHQRPGLVAIGKIERIREINGKITGKTAYYLLSTILTLERFNQAARQHWGVENQLHWWLDAILNEDQDRTGLGNAPRKPRRPAPHGHEYCAKNKEKGSWRGKIKRARWDEAFLIKLIGAI